MPVYLLSSDGKTVIVDDYVAVRTMKITNFVEDYWGKIYPVQGTTADTLFLVINFCTMKVLFDQNVNGVDRQLVEFNRKNWTAGFFSVSKITLLDLAVAAKYLGIDSLFVQACKALRSRLIP